MPSNATIGDLQTTIRHMGKGVVFHSPGAFAGTGNDLVQTFLGDTEGEITVEENAEFAMLTAPELTGPIPHAKYLEGISPVITIPLLSADPALDIIVNPTGVASGSQGGGYERHQPVSEFGLTILPEELFIENNVAVIVDYTTALDWQVGGDVASPAQLALLDKGIWFWRGHFEALAPRYVHEEGGKMITEVLFHCMNNFAMQQGHYIYTKGRPDQALIPIEISVA